MHTPVHIHTLVPAHIHTLVRAHIHTLVRAHTHTHARAHPDSHKHNINTSTYLSIQAHVCTHSSHTCAHKHACTHIRSLSSLSLSLSLSLATPGGTYTATRYPHQTHTSHTLPLNLSMERVIPACFLVPTCTLAPFHLHPVAPPLPTPPTVCAVSIAV